jgi:hypothetical protein
VVLAWRNTADRSPLSIDDPQTTQTLLRQHLSVNLCVNIIATALSTINIVIRTFVALRSGVFGSTVQGVSEPRWWALRYSLTLSERVGAMPDAENKPPRSEVEKLPTSSPDNDERGRMIQNDA